MNVEGENAGWLYSFVSESDGSVISIPYSGGEVRNVQAQELPPDQIERIAGDTLSTEELVDTPEAVQRSEEIRSYLEENPQAGGSAGVDSASGDEPEWILSVPAEGLQDRVSRRRQNGQLSTLDHASVFALVPTVRCGVLLSGPP